MKKKKFNGFASEAQYEAVKKLIKTEIDNLSDTIMIDYNQETNVVRVFVDDKVYTMVDGNGVVELNFNPTSPNLPYVYWEIFNRLNDISDMIFKTINSQLNNMDNWYIKIYENGKLVGEKYYFDKDACFQDYTTFILHFWHMESFSTDKITYTQKSGRNFLGYFEAKLDRCINNKHHYTLIRTNLN